MTHNLRPLRNEVVQTLRDFSADPTLIGHVEAAWGEAEGSSNGAI